MCLPDDNHIWQRIRGLQGKTIRTVEQGKPNTIVHVSASDIEIQGRDTKPTRADVLCYCRVLVRDKMVTKRNRPIFGWDGGHKTGRIIMAILADALPDYVQAFTRNNPYDPGLSGIRLTQSC
jgi:hypothetical protein